MGSYLSASTKKQIDDLVKYFVDNHSLVDGFLEQVLVHLRQSKSLQHLIHTTRSRTKEPSHLREKLERKAKAAKISGQQFSITPETLFTTVTDLAGIRLLHLHTSQISDINKEIRSIFEEQKFPLLEGPFARTWDDEYREFFETIGVTTQKSPTMYTSVHYVIASGSRTTITCEIQVRTLMEEVWGEVDHTINYPTPATSVACREQIRALARATSSATRLVDSIFATVKDISEHAEAAAKPKKAKPRK